jgi:ABC-type uncharacterized transport system permease subunit
MRAQHALVVFSTWMKYWCIVAVFVFGQLDAMVNGEW